MTIKYLILYSVRKKHKPGFNNQLLTANPQLECNTSLKQMMRKNKFAIAKKLEKQQNSFFKKRVEFENIDFVQPTGIELRTFSGGSPVGPPRRTPASRPTSS